MKKFINDSVNLVPEALRGLARAHREILSLHEKPAFVARAPLAKGKVALLSGGGSGHEPLHAGFVVSGWSVPPFQGRCSPRRRPTRSWRRPPRSGGGEGW